MNVVVGDYTLKRSCEHWAIYIDPVIDRVFKSGFCYFVKQLFLDFHDQQIFSNDYSVTYRYQIILGNFNPQYARHFQHYASLHYAYYISSLYVLLLLQQLHIYVIQDINCKLPLLYVQLITVCYYKCAFFREI